MCIERFSMRLVKVKTHKSQRPKRAELIPVSLAWSMPKSIVTPAWTGSYSIAGLPPHPLSSMSPVPIYTPEWRETKWSKAPCLRKQRDGRGVNPGTPDLEFEVLTARPHTPPLSHDVTSAVLVFQNNMTAAMLVSQAYPVGVELFSDVDSFSCSDKFA